MKGVTLDSVSLRGAGVVHIVQHAKGSRFTLDSVLLADFCRIKPRDRVLEPGTGTGVVSILLAKKFSKSRITAVEIQIESADLCRWNVHINGLQDRISVLNQDLKRLKGVLIAGLFDVIVANPPYTKAGAGKSSPLRGRQTARHEREARLEQWLDQQRMLKNGGRYYLVFTATRLAELVSLMREGKLEPKRLRLVHPYRDKPASLALIEAVKSAGTGLEVLPPLVVHEEGGGYSEEMKEVYGL